MKEYFVRKIGFMSWAVFTHNPGENNSQIRRAQGPLTNHRSWKSAARTAQDLLIAYREGRADKAFEGVLTGIEELGNETEPDQRDTEIEQLRRTIEKLETANAKFVADRDQWVENFNAARRLKEKAEAETRAAIDGLHVIIDAWERLLGEIDAKEVTIQDAARRCLSKKAWMKAGLESLNAAIAAFAQVEAIALSKDRSPREPQ